MQRAAFRAHHIGHDYIKYSRGSPEADCPFQVLSGSRKRIPIGSQQRQHGILGNSTKQRKHNSAKYGAVKAKGRYPAHLIVFFAPQGTAHQAGTAYAEQIIHRIEGQ